jgi:AbrB family looped-hinge helix DNA binding protein
MKTKLSTKGQVVLPGPIRLKLGLRPGDALDARVENGSVLLTPHRQRVRKAKIITDPLTGLPVLTVGKNAPVLTSKQVSDMLAEFP